jgi:glycerophosphoryl diester phosphodiesterase
VSERSFSQEATGGAGGLVVAHRGASDELPENTIAAFERAIEVGADAVEFDVRLTADRIPVVLHDADVARTTDGAGALRDLSLAEVKRLTIEGGHEVPTLDEALTTLSGRIAIDLEIKNIPGEPDFTPDEEPVVDATLRALDAAAFLGPVLISSFNPGSLRRSRHEAPQIPTGLLTEYSVDAVAALTFATAEGHPWVLPFVGQVRAAGDGFAQEVHRAGRALGTWLVDDPAEAIALLRDGLDAVATNDPAAVVTARHEASGA